MYHIILLISLLKSLEPFFRKDVLQTLNSDEFLLINTTLIFIAIMCYGSYLYFFKKAPIQIFQKCCELSMVQLVMLVAISAMTFVSAVSIFHISGQYNTLVSNTLLKTISTVFVGIIGWLFYNEELTTNQIYGTILTIGGIYLISKK